MQFKQNQFRNEREVRSQNLKISNQSVDKSRRSSDLSQNFKKNLKKNENVKFAIIALFHC